MTNFTTAMDLWLTGLAQNTARAYRDAWDQLEKFCGRGPGSVLKADVKSWVQNMRERGLSDGTIAQRLAGISSFYEFYNHDFIDDGDSPVANPARAKRLRPRVQPYGKAVYLNNDQVKLLLGSIDRSTVLGSRDYALFLSYILTARRNSELRKLRYGDLAFSGSSIWYTWSGKGKRDQRYELPAAAWAAIEKYLVISKRADTIRSDDYLFIGMHGSGSRPLVSRSVGRLLKHYCRLAGLDAVRIHVHSLRHTGAMLRLQAGEDVTEICEDLGHSSLEVTSIYLHLVQGHVDTHASKVMDLIS